MLKRLTALADQINELLLQDEFPGSIRPEYLREAVLAYPSNGGKRLRPALVVWSCGLFCQNPEKALHAAAATEMFHTWTLVHDDIIDRDSTRRGQPTSHVQLAEVARKNFKTPDAQARHFGASMAILTGDLQQAWAVSLLIGKHERMG